MTPITAECGRGQRDAANQVDAAAGELAHVGVSLGGVTFVVDDDQFDHAAVDAAGGVDLVTRDFGADADRCADHCCEPLKGAEKPIRMGPDCCALAWRAMNGAATAEAAKPPTSCSTADIP